MERKLVNWINAMELTPEYFRQTEDFFISLISDSISTTLDNHKYGLLPPLKGEQQSTLIDIQENVTGNVEIRLRKCNAITNGGYLIRFNPAPEDYIISNCLQDIVNSGRNEWYIILFIDPYKRIPTGTPDPEEEPLRHPDVEPSVELLIMPFEAVNSQKLNAQQLIIGKIKKQGERYRIDENFVPPCTHMISFSSLINYYNNFASFINNIEKASKEIIVKVRNKENPSQLAFNIEMICRNFMRYISTIYFSFRNNGLYWTPIKMTECFSNLAHIYYVSLSFMSITEKEELLNYFHEWSEISPGIFEKKIAEVLEMQYDHNNIDHSMKLIYDFLDIQAQLWTRLSLLEYIGQHKENIIVSDKRLIDKNSQKGNWTVLG